MWGLHRAGLEGNDLGPVGAAGQDRRQVARPLLGRAVHHQCVGLHAGADARQVAALVSAGVKGLVVAATGNGTVHQSLLAALEQARSHGLAVRLSTRCAKGQIVGVPVAGQTAEPGLNAYKARIDLMLDLMA